MRIKTNGNRKELLDVREFISQVLIAAANQREDTVIK